MNLSQDLKRYCKECGNVTHLYRETNQLKHITLVAMIVTLSIALILVIVSSH